jgi:hypothetical protein
MADFFNRPFLFITGVPGGLAEQIAGVTAVRRCRNPGNPREIDIFLINGNRISVNFASAIDCFAVLRD